MNVKRIMQWVILTVCAAAFVLNVLYLTSVLGQHAATWGFLLVVACFAAHLLLKKRYVSDTPDTPVERLRGILTAVLAIAWLVTAGMAFVWVK